MEETVQGTSLGVGDIAAVVIYFILILGVGLWSMFRPNRDTIEGYFLAGKHMFWLPVGASIFASNIGSEHFIGLAGTGAASGIGVAAFEFNALVLLQLLGFVFLPVFIASKVRTLPEYMDKRFGGTRIGTYLAVLSMILYIFTKISVDLYSGALFIQQALQWNLYLSILALLAMTFICTVGGGLAAVIYIDVVQVAIMLGGSTALLVKGLQEVGGWEQLQIKYMTSVPNVTYTNPSSNATCGFPRSDSWVMLRDPVDSDMPWPGFILGQTPASIWYWCADQMMVQKALSAKSLSDAQGATIFTGWIKIAPMFLIVIPGMISRVLYPDTVGCVDPEICMAFCGNPTSCSNTAYPRLVLGIMPEGLRGIMIAVMLAALMSDLTSIFNSASTLFTIDIYRKIRKHSSTRELLLVGRLFILVLVGVSIAWIPLIQQMMGGQLYLYIQSIAAYLSPPIAVVYCMAILWPRTNEQGAFWGLMFGLIVGMARMICQFSYREPLCMEDAQPIPIFLAIHYMYFAAVLFFSTGLVTIIVSLFTPPTEAYRLARTTFATRFDETVREDEEKDFLGTELMDIKKETKNGHGEVCTNGDGDHDEGTDIMVESGIQKGLCQRLFSWAVLGEEQVEGNSKKHHQELEDHIEELTHLTQTHKQKAILYTNLIIITGVAVWFYIYFSFNPFTEDRIQEFKQIARNNTVISVYAGGNGTEEL